MKRFLILAAFACFGVAMGIPSGAQVISGDDAAATTGAVRLDGLRCNSASADCNLYNQALGFVFPCPTGSGLCSECEVNQPWDTCVQATSSQSCNWLGNGHNCGSLLLGACDGDNCVLISVLGRCVKSPRCL